MPILTIAIPTHNGEKYVFETLVSVWNEIRNLDEVEILVIENASNDGTPGELERAKLAGARFRVVRHENLLSMDRNFAKAVVESKSEYVWFVADDDVLLSNSVRAVLNEIAVHSPGVIMCRTLNFETASELNSNLGRLGEEQVRTISKRVWRAGQDAFFETGFSILGIISAICVKRDLFLSELNELSQPHRDGFQFMHIIPVVMLNAGCVLIEEPLVGFRQYPKRWITSSDHSISLEIDYIVHPQIMRALVSQGYSQVRMFALVSARAAAMASHASIAKLSGFKMNRETAIQILRANSWNPVIVLMLPLFFFPAIIATVLAKVLGSINRFFFRT